MASNIFSVWCLKKSADCGKGISCCFKPGTLSNKCCLIFPIETLALLPVFVRLRIWTTKLCCFTRFAAIPEKFEIWKL